MIPEFVKLPKATNGHSKEDRKKPLRVCDDCYKRIVNIPQPSKDAPVSIDQLLIWKEKEDTLQRQWANYQLSKFRQTQYSMVGHVSFSSQTTNPKNNCFFQVFDADEKALLWTNRNLIVGHSNYFTQMLLSFDYETATTQEVEELNKLITRSYVVDSKDPQQCWKLMCSRTCKHYLDKDCILQLLQHRYNGIRECALQNLEMLSQRDEGLLIDLIPFLVRHALSANIIQNWLLKRCSTNERVANEIFYTLQSYLDFEKFQNTNYLGKGINRGENPTCEMVCFFLFPL